MRIALGQKTAATATATTTTRRRKRRRRRRTSTSKTTMETQRPCGPVNHKNVRCSLSDFLG